MFASYEAEFDATLEALQNSVKTAQDLDDNFDERRNVLHKCGADVNSLESLIRQMTVESRANPTPEYKKRVNAAKDRLKVARADLASVQQVADRDDLLGARSSGQNGGSNQPLLQLSETASRDRGRFAEATARMDRSNETLLNSRRTIAETEDIAVSITENLASNRATIIGAHERVMHTNGLIGRSAQILRNMRRMEARRKAILVGLIAFLIFMISLIVYFAIRPAAPDTTAAPEIID